MKENIKYNYLPHISIDCVVFGFHEKQLKVLLLKFKNTDVWCLPGGFVKSVEDIDESATRILRNRAGLTDIYLEQCRVFGKKDRTNGDTFQRILSPEIYDDYDEAWYHNRYLSIAYFTLVDYSKVNPVLDHLCDAYFWYDLKHLPNLIFDHAEIINTTLSFLQHNLDEKLMQSDLLPETFTMNDLQSIYEAVLSKTLRRNNFQRKMLNLDILERQEKLYTGAQNKAPYLYKFKKNENQSK